MKKASCKKCGKEFSVSLDDGAYGGDDFELCDLCRGEPQTSTFEKSAACAVDKI